MNTDMNSIAAVLDTANETLLKAAKRIMALEKALAYAIKKADGWCDDSRGVPVNTPEMDEARKLLEDAKPFTVDQLQKDVEERHTQQLRDYSASGFSDNLKLAPQ